MKKLPYQNPKLPVEQRVADLLSRMTFEEKLVAVDEYNGPQFVDKRHESNFSQAAPDAEVNCEKLAEVFGDKTPGLLHDFACEPQVFNKMQRYFVENTRLHIPVMTCGEGLHGAFAPGATVFPCPLTLAATFDTDAVKAVGEGMGAESRVYSVHETFNPVLDLGRDHRWGRIEEAFGEDVCLTSEMGVAIIKGMQGDDVSSPEHIVAEPKHYVAHGVPIRGMNTGASSMGRREVESQHLRTFEAAVVRGGAYNLMSCYNSLDGEVVSGSKFYLTEVPKKRWGMRGFIRSDFGAVNRLTHSHGVASNPKDAIAISFGAGLDVQGFEYSNKVWQDSIRELIEEGRIPMERLDDAVGRILRVKFDLGLFENPYTDEKLFSKALRSEKHIAAAWKSAREAVTLLENRESFLPLSKNIKKLAVVGPNADCNWYGDYTPVLYGFTAETLLDGVKKLVSSDTEVVHEPACVISIDDDPVVNWTTVLNPERNGNGLRCEIFANTDFAGAPVRTSTDTFVAYNWKNANPVAATAVNYLGDDANVSGQTHTAGSAGISARWTGFYKPAFRLQNMPGKRLMRLYFKSAESVRMWLDGELIIDSFGNTEKKNWAELELDLQHTYAIKIEYSADEPEASIGLCLDWPGDAMGRAVKACAESDVCILCVGDDRDTTGENKDRSDLHLPGRQRELVRRCLETGTPVVLALIHGRAFDLTDELSHDSLRAIISGWLGGEKGGSALAEAIFGEFSPAGRCPVSFPKHIGQNPCFYSKLPGDYNRYLDDPSANPRWSFGHGLSYTSFEYSDLEITPENGGATLGFDVSFKVKNTGASASDEVVQVYLGDRWSSVVTPKKELKAFKRAHFAPGEEKSFAFHLCFDDMKLLNLDWEWVVEPGEFDVYVGAASDDIRLTGVFTVR